MAKQVKRKGGGGGGQIWDPQTFLTGRKLKRASKKLTGLELNPEIKGYRRVADEIRGEGRAQASGLEALGGRLSGQVSGAYQSLAQAEAENVARQAAIRNMLNQTSGNIASQAGTEQTQAQQGGLGGYMESLQARGSQGGGQAQQALADMVAAQRARLAGTSQAAQQTAAAQGSGYASFASSQAASNQQRGAEAQSSLASTIGSRIGESNLRYGQDYREAMGKLAEAKAKRGPTRVKNLLELRSKEREYELGRAATKIDKAKAKETARSNRAGESLDLLEEAGRNKRAAKDRRLDKAKARAEKKKKKKSGGGGTGGTGLPGL